MGFQWWLMVDSLWSKIDPDSSIFTNHSPTVVFACTKPRGFGMSNQLIHVAEAHLGHQHTHLSMGQNWPTQTADSVGSTTHSISRYLIWTHKVNVLARAMRNICLWWILWNSTQWIVGLAKVLVHKIWNLAPSTVPMPPQPPAWGNSPHAPGGPRISCAAPDLAWQCPRGRCWGDTSSSWCILGLARSTAGKFLVE